MQTPVTLITPDHARPMASLTRMLGHVQSFSCGLHGRHFLKTGVVRQSELRCFCRVLPTQRRNAPIPKIPIGPQLIPLRSLEAVEVERLKFGDPSLAREVEGFRTSIRTFPFGSGPVPSVAGIAPHAKGILLEFVQPKGG